MSPARRPFLCIIAGQRAGTTALRTALSASGAFQSFGEIFQEGASGFPAFARARNLPVDVLLSPFSAAGMWDDYLDRLDAGAGPAMPLIDVKLNAWAGLRPPWGYASDEPILMRRLKARGSRFLFIQRQDLAAQVLSGRLAEAAGKWQDLEPQDAPPPLRLDPDWALARAREILQAERAIWGHIATYRSALPQQYETLFQRNLVARPVQDWIAAGFGLAFKARLRAQIMRNQVDPATVVQNHAEIAEAIAALVAAEGRVNPVAAA